MLTVGVCFPGEMRRRRKQKEDARPAFSRFLVVLKKKFGTGHSFCLFLSDSYMNKGFRQHKIGTEKKQMERIEISIDVAYETGVFKNLNEKNVKCGSNVIKAESKKLKFSLDKSVIKTNNYIYK